MAIRFDNTADFLSRTAALPVGTSFTACGWAQQTTDINVVSVIFSLNEAADQYLIGYNTDGSTFALYGRTGGAAPSNFATSPALGEPFFWAMKRGGSTTVTGYWKYPHARFVTATQTATGSAATANFRIGMDGFANSGINGLIWNVRVWDRALTEPELIAESLSDEPVTKHMLHAWYRMDHQGDNFDYGPWKKHSTKNGTLTTEWPRVMVPRRKVWKPRLIVSEAPAVGGDAVPQCWAQYRRRAA